MSMSVDVDMFIRTRASLGSSLGPDLRLLFSRCGQCP
jgi:hypothetical protein